MKEKILASISIIVLVFCFYSFSTSKGATLQEQQQEIQQKKEETKQNLEYVKEELSTRLVKIQELDDQIKKSENEIKEMETELTDIQTRVDVTTENLKKVEQDYKENEKLLEERLVVLYETGDVGFIDILMHSAGIIDFISNYYTIEQVVQNDTELLETIEKERKQVEDTKRELEKQKANLKVIKAKKEQTKVTLENNKIIQENEINQLNEEEIKLQEEIEKYKREEENIQSLIQIASSNYTYSGEYTGGVMIWPVAKSGTYITSNFGIREHPIQGIIKQHTGIDIGNAGFGAPAVAAADGVVSMASYYGGYGNCVMINHGNGVSTLYGHGQKILTTVGTVVKKGDLIMEVGSTGNSTGPHLHFEVRINGSPVNPLPYLQGNNTMQNQ